MEFASFFHVRLDKDLNHVSLSYRNFVCWLEWKYERKQSFRFKLELYSCKIEEEEFGGPESGGVKAFVISYAD